MTSGPCNSPTTLPSPAAPTGRNMSWRWFLYADHTSEASKIAETCVEHGAEECCGHDRMTGNSDKSLSCDVLLSLGICRVPDASEVDQSSIFELVPQ